MTVFFSHKRWLFFSVLLTVYGAYGAVKKAPSSVSVVSPRDFSKVNQSKLPILLEVHADWCLLSQKMKPVLNSVAKTFHKKIKFTKILIDSFEDKDLTIQFLKKAYNITISWVPTLLFIKNGKVIATLKEGMDVATLTQKLKLLLKSS